MSQALALFDFIDTIPFINDYLLVWMADHDADTVLVILVIQTAMMEKPPSRDFVEVEIRDKTINFQFAAAKGTFSQFHSYLQL
jgi:hypothetical protein